MQKKKLYKRFYMAENKKVILRDMNYVYNSKHLSCIFK